MLQQSPPSLLDQVLTSKLPSAGVGAGPVKDVMPNPDVVTQPVLAHSDHLRVEILQLQQLGKVVQQGVAAVHQPGLCQPNLHAVLHHPALANLPIPQLNIMVSQKNHLAGELHLGSDGDHVVLHQQVLHLHEDNASDQPDPEWFKAAAGKQNIWLRLAMTRNMFAHDNEGALRWGPHEHHSGPGGIIKNLNLYLPDILHQQGLGQDSDDVLSRHQHVYEDTEGHLLHVLLLRQQLNPTSGVGSL